MTDCNMCEPEPCKSEEEKCMFCEKTKGLLGYDDDYICGKCLEKLEVILRHYFRKWLAISKCSKEKDSTAGKQSEV
ncbi:hypothetical protein LJC10_00680 [Selenomonadales bacterium OttesenSCG-928-I06]|nr:hypothetical protein [Selenomonadales bacterium OttesenSCG-928-I06]